MDRWWYSEDKKNDKDKIQKSKKSPSKGSEEQQSKKWKFQVVINDLALNATERIAITGNCYELGNWDPDNCILLDKVDGNVTQ